MLFNAVVLADIYDDIDPINEWLKSHGFKVFVINHSEDLNHIQLQFKEPFLFFRTPYLRVQDPKAALLTHCNMLKKHPEATVLNVNGYNYLSVAPGGLKFQEYQFLPSTNSRISHKSDSASFLPQEAKTPNVIMYTNNRDTYLQQSLNSLLFSLQRPFPLKIFLNGATDEVKRVVDGVVKRNPWIDVIAVDKNAKYAVTNLAIQWLLNNGYSGVNDPITFWEDDFILPSFTFGFYPFWLNSFSARLKYVDMVGWASSMENGYLSMRARRYLPKPFGEWIYAKSGEKIEGGYLLAAHGLTLTINHFLKSYDKDLKTSIDSRMHRKSSHVAFPSLTGYHIGWNQIMDGYGDLKGRDTVSLPGDEYTLTNIKTGRTESYHLDNIEKYM